MRIRVRRDKRECVSWRRISTLMEAQMVYRIAFSLLALAVAIGLVAFAVYRSKVESKELKEMEAELAAAAGE